MKNELVLEETKTLETKKIEKEVEKGNVTEEKVESSLNYNDLSKEEKKIIDDFVAKMELESTTDVLSYGKSAQTEIAKFSDSVLENVKTKSTGEVGDLLSNLVVEIKEFDAMSDIKDPKGILAVFTSVKKRIQKLMAKYNKVNTNVDKIETALENHKVTLLRDIAIFDDMYEKNLDSFKLISLYIIAGDKKLEELKTKTLPELQAQAKKTGDEMDVQKVNDMEALINRFEKKLYDLKTTRLISIQMAPQIRLIQNNDSELVEKIESSITNTIPLWKNQIVIALGLANSKSALKAQQKVSELTNDMLKQNSENLKQGTIDIARESEKAIVDIETLKKTNKDIIDTLTTVIQIHEEGSKKRLEAEKELNVLENELKEKLMNLKEEK